MEEEIAEEEVEETTPEVEEESTEEPKEESKEETEDPKEDIPVRSTASYIIERQKRTIEKLRSQEESEDPVTERLDRIEEIALGQSDERELNEFFEREPDAKQYAPKMREYMKHDAYKGASPEVIFHHLDYSASKAKTDSKRKAADLEAKQTKSVGSGIRETRSSDQKTAEEIRNMSLKDFAEYERELHRNARS